MLGALSTAGQKDSQEQEASPGGNGEERRSPLDNSEVEEPVGDGGDGVGVGTGAERVNLGGVEPTEGGKDQYQCSSNNGKCLPRELKPGGPEEEKEEEKAENRSVGCHRLSVDEASEGDDHGEALSSGADEEPVRRREVSLRLLKCDQVELYSHLATANTLNDKVRSESGEGVYGNVDS